MIRIVWIVLAAALAWAIYWFVGSAALERGWRSALDEMRAAGWRVELADLAVHGFPNRFDTTFDAPRLTEPHSGLTWEAPFFQILALSYRPNRVIAIFPDTERLSGPFGAAQITTGRARGSATMKPVPALTLDHSQFVIEALGIASGDLALRMEELLFATRLPDGPRDGRVQNIGLTIRDLDLPTGPAEATRVDFATLDADIALDAPLDRHALSEPPAVTGIDIATLRLDWGEVRLAAEGSLDIGADGRPIGVLELDLANWPEALDRAEALGLIGAAEIARIRQAAGILAALGPDRSALSLPLTFRDGEMLLGPVPLGPAPRL